MQTGKIAVIKMKKKFRCFCRCFWFCFNFRHFKSIMYVEVLYISHNFCNTMIFCDQKQTLLDQKLEKGHCSVLEMGQKCRFTKKCQSKMVTNCLFFAFKKKVLKRSFIISWSQKVLKIVDFME